MKDTPTKFQEKEILIHHRKIDGVQVGFYFSEESNNKIPVLMKQLLLSAFYDKHKSAYRIN